LRRNGRFDRECQHRPKRKPGDSRAVKIEIDPLYVDMRASLQKYTHRQISTLVSTAEKHERSLTLFVPIVVHLSTQSKGPPPVWTQHDRKV
jgi:hypothetical protein